MIDAENERRHMKQRMKKNDVNEQDQAKSTTISKRKERGI
jgi:hypothetical protein